MIFPSVFFRNPDPDFDFEDVFLPPTDISFMASLKSFFSDRGKEHPRYFNKALVQAVWKACLGNEDALPGIQDRIFNKMILLLNSKHIQWIDKCYKENIKSPEVLQEKLLMYSEGLRRKGFDESSSAIQNFAIKLVLLPLLLELLEAKGSKAIKEGIQKCKEAVEALDLEIEDLKKLSVNIIPLASIEELVRKIVPKKTTKESIREYSSFI